MKTGGQDCAAYMNDMLRLPKVFTILPGVPFAKALATQLWQEYKHDLSALSDVQIYLPNRRSARALADTFLEVSDGQATLLPKLTPLGDIDEEDLLEEDPFILEEDPFLTPAIPALERQLILTQLIMARKDISVNAPEAFSLAGELARLLDRAHTEQIDLGQLEDFVTGDLATHWQKTRDFLEIVTKAWPMILAERGQSDPAARRNIIFEKKIDALRKKPPQHRVIAAGSTGSILATAKLLDVIARLPNGCVVLPGIDPVLDDRIWDAIDEQHPYYYQKRLITMMEIDRKSIQCWPHQELLPDQKQKLQLTHLALQPQAIFDLSDAKIDKDRLKNFEFIRAENPLHEAKIIALQLRNVLNTPERTAMVVTPDRVLAQYIQQEMLRWDIAVNDSAGRSLEETPIGLFMKLIAGFPETSCPQTHLLSLLRHEYFRLHPPIEKREADIHALETALRKDFLPSGGIFELAKHYENPLLQETLAILEPFCSKERKPLQEWLAAHITIAEQLATTPNVPGAEILWRFEEGESAAQLFHKLYEAAPSHPIAMNAQDYAGFIASTLSQIIVRPRYGTHPRIRILSPIEARAQEADLVILAGLNEGVWPGIVKPNTWLSRPMQTEMGFGSPDLRLGQSALDFQLLFCVPNVLVTWSKKREGVLAHPSRWLQQVFAVMHKNDCLPAFDVSDYITWAAQWDEPTILSPTPAPEYAPPLAARRRKLPVTAIETLIKDPYAIYAKEILKIKPAEELDRHPDARDWGNAAHKIIENFFRENGLQQSDPSAVFDNISNVILAAYPLSTAQEKAWRGKLNAIRDWLLQNEQGNDAEIVTEKTMSMKIDLSDGQPFEIYGRADRLDITNGGIAITDYKTGIIPTKKQINNGQAPQLPLLGLLAKQNAGWENKEIDLRYIKLSGKLAGPAEIKPLDAPNELIQLNDKNLHELLDEYYTKETPFQAKLLPANAHDNYWHLKRVAEWATLDDDDDGEDA
jgi:ATP-dependent helicase/nuclease subunit B